jgi:DNA polymerase
MIVTDPTTTAIDVAQQVRAHVESLRSAGLLFLPRAEAFVIAPTVQAEHAEEVPPPRDPLETRKHELAVLRAEVAACDKCSELYSTRTQTVFGTGPLDAEVAFVGEAPGSDEDTQGEPFAGKGGELLRRIIAACQFTTAQTYLFNIIKCRTPRNRAPKMDECANCRDFFRRQFEIVKPKYVVALGTTAARLLSGKKGTLADLRGQLHTYRGVPLVCTHHPNDIENDKSNTLRRECWEDMKFLMATMSAAPKE